MESIVLSQKTVPRSVLSRLETRDIGLWVETLPEYPTAELISFLSLPWRFVILSDTDAVFLQRLEKSASTDQILLRRRGFVQVIDSDPSRIELATGSLPVYLLNGRRGENSVSFESQLRKLTILEAIRRSDPRRGQAANRALQDRGFEKASSNRFGRRANSMGMAASLRLQPGGRLDLRESRHEGQTALLAKLDLQGLPQTNFAGRPEDQGASWMVHVAA
ncbi:MAG: hypothetical protein ABSG51_15715 [Terracidiphilus sp.]